MTAADLDHPVTGEPDRPVTAEPDRPVTAEPDRPVTAEPGDPVTAEPGDPGAHQRVGRGLPQISKALGVLLGSTTVLTAIMFYFGWSWAYYFYMYFGVDSSLLGLSTRDYVQLSVDGLFVPLAVVASITLAVLWGWSGLATWSRRHGRSAAVTWGLPIAGALLFLNGLSAIVRTTPLNTHLAVAPACLAAGAGALVFALRRHRAAIGATASEPTLVAEWAALLVLGGLSLLWVANDYSASVGQSRAEQFVREMPAMPDATLFSEKSLGLAHAGIREVRCTDPKAAYGYRYDGLKLVLQSGDEYLLLPSGWSPRRGVAVLLPRTDAIRLEFTAAGSAHPAAPTC